MIMVLLILFMFIVALIELVITMLYTIGFVVLVIIYWCVIKPLEKLNKRGG